MDFKMELAVTRSEALELLYEHWDITPQTEFVSLSQALGRVTAKTYYACNTLPVCRSSMVDGIAVKSAAFGQGIPDTSTWQKGVHYVQADTGDDFPDDFDTVIPVESIYYDGTGKLHFNDNFVFVPGKYISRAGSQVKEGELLVQSGVRLRPIHLAALAMGGVHQIEVIKKLRVAYMPTGSELVPPGVKPKRGQNIESNGLMVSAFLEQWGAEAICYPIVKDKPLELEQMLDQALAAADLVLINGGSSKGEEDFNSDVLQKRASFFRHGIKAIPGRPVGISMINKKPVINLPGPVIATLLAMDWCVFGLVHHYYGLTPTVRPTLKVKLGRPLYKPAGFERYVWLTLEKSSDGYIATDIGLDNSLPAKLLRPQALFIASFDAERYQAGEEIEVELLCGFEELPK
jgi:molybdopterin molybdotransferase